MAVNIDAGYQAMVLKDSDEEFRGQLVAAREMRRVIDEKLESLAHIVPALLTPEELQAHKALVRDLVSHWTRLHACMVALEEEPLEEKAKAKK
jgi:hypothetical protein